MEAEAVKGPGKKRENRKGPFPQRPLKALFKTDSQTQCIKDTKKYCKKESFLVVFQNTVYLWIGSTK